MNSALIFGGCGATLVGLGMAGFVLHRHLLRRFLAFNVTGSGVFLVFGASAHRHPGTATDAVPQAMIITGIVVAFAATALAIMLTVALARARGRVRLPEDEDAGE